MHQYAHLTDVVASQTLQLSFTLTDVMYQAGLTVQSDCGTCCDGRHICDAFSVCRPRKNGVHGVCVPEDAKDSSVCSDNVHMKEVLRCESCDKPSPAAQLFESNHKLT